MEQIYLRSCLCNRVAALHGSWLFIPTVLQTMLVLLFDGPISVPFCSRSFAYEVSLVFRAFG